jgi:hypothetical protein
MSYVKSYTPQALQIRVNRTFATYRRPFYVENIESRLTREYSQYLSNQWGIMYAVPQFQCILKSPKGKSMREVLKQMTTFQVAKRADFPRRRRLKVSHR